MKILTSKILIPLGVFAVFVGCMLWVPKDNPAHAASSLPDAGHYTVISNRGYEVDSAMEVCYKGTTYVIFYPYTNGSTASVEFVDGHTVACK